MTNNFMKQVGQSAKDQAKQIAKQIAREPSEILKDTTRQVTGQTETGGKPEMSVMQQVMTGDGRVKDLSSQEEQSINVQAKRRLQEIEGQLRQLRMQREQMSEDWAKQQQELLQAPQGERPKTFELPSSPKKGPKGPGHKRQGTQETGKQYKG